MIEIAEKSQIFSFPDSWSAQKFDDPQGFVGKEWKCSEVQCRVDILAHDGDRLYLIEIKDFRGRQEALERKLHPSSQDALWRAACRKLRDSIMILLGAHRLGDSVLEPYCATLFDGPDAKIDAILFLDRDAEVHRTATGFLSSANLRDRLAKQLRPLRFECAVLSQDTMPAGHPWSVRDHPAPAGRREDSKER